jgi:hypothetical protein
MRRVVVVGLTAVAFAGPVAAAAGYPGERAWQDPAVTEPYMTASANALERLYPADERHCAGGILLLVADALGTAEDGTPATAAGEACRIVIGSVWLPSAYGDHAAYKRLLCTVFAHERAHAELDRRHVADPGDLMYYGPLSVTLPECSAAFPDPSDGFVKPGFGSVPRPAPPPAAAPDVAERVCIPGWAAHSTRAIRRHYLEHRRMTAWRLYRQWARERPRRGARARARGRHCTAKPSTAATSSANAAASSAGSSATRPRGSVQVPTTVPSSTAVARSMPPPGRTRFAHPAGTANERSFQPSR